jgi:hypothetical protein
MSNDGTFGFEELQKAFNHIEKKYPDKTDAMLMALGRMATSKTKAKTPIGKTKKLRGSWRLKKPKRYGKSRVVRTQSQAPHAHLVELGHEIVRGGKTRKRGRYLNTMERKVRGIQSKGRVEGKKMLETSFKEMETTFNKSVEKLLDDLTSEVEI